MRRKNLLTIFTLGMFITGCIGTEKYELTGDSELKVYSVDYLSLNREKYNGERVMVRGYVRSGFNGFHIECFMSSSKHNDNNSILLNNKACYIFEKARYIEGYAVVSGTYYHEVNPIFLHGDIYTSQIEGAEIAWD